MPFLLLDDANQTVLDELQQHVQGLLAPPAAALDDTRQRVLDELQAHVQAAQNALSTPQPLAPIPAPEPSQSPQDAISAVQGAPLDPRVDARAGTLASTRAASTVQAVADSLRGIKHQVNLDELGQHVSDLLAQNQLVRNLTGTNPDQADLEQRFLQAQQAAQAQTGSSVQLPSSPTDVLNASPYGVGTAGEDLTNQRNAAIEQANPLRDIPGTTGLAQMALDPTNLLLAPGVSTLGRSAIPAAIDLVGEDLGSIGSRRALASLRADVQRQSALPAPPPPPSSPERIDWLTGQGKWAPPATSESTGLDKALAVGVNGMIGGTNSMVSNALSGLAENVMRPVTTALVRRELGPALADVRAQAGAVGDALANMRTTFLTGQRASQIASADYPEAFPGWKGALPFTTGNIRANTAMDEFNRTLATAGAQAAELARLQAANPGVSAQDLVQQNAQQLVDVGTAAAKTATFESGGTGIGDALSRARAKLTSPDASEWERLGGLLTQMAVPFSKIPDVILSRGVLETPLIGAEPRLAVNMVRAIRNGDTEAAKQAVSQYGLTSAVNGAIFWQAQQGNITGNGPDDPAKKAALQNARDADGNPIWQANSLRIPTPWGVRWIPYTSLGPVAIRMAAISNAVEQYDAQSSKVNPDFLRATSKAIGETITDAWYLQGVASIFQALKTGDIFDAAGNVALDFGERYVPDSALTNQLRQYTDPTVRQPTNVLEDVANRIPGASLLVPPRINPATGLPTQAPKDVLSAVVRSSAPGQPDPVSAALAMHNMGVGAAPGTISMNRATIEITPAEQRQYQQVAGAAIANDVQATLGSPSYQRMSQEQQRQVLADVVRKGRAYAEASVFRDIPRAELLRRMDSYDASQRMQALPVVRSLQTDNIALRPISQPEVSVSAPAAAARPFVGTDEEQVVPRRAPLVMGAMQPADVDEQDQGPPSTFLVLLRQALARGDDDDPQLRTAVYAYVAQLQQALQMARARGDQREAAQIQQLQAQLDQARAA